MMDREEYLRTLWVARARLTGLFLKGTPEILKVDPVGARTWSQPDYFDFTESDREWLHTIGVRL